VVAGDVAEKAADIEWALRTLRARFATVIWVPGNHELWSLSTDPVQLRGEARYQYLVTMCRRAGVITPEDPFPVWRGDGGPVVIVPTFVLYDYSFRPDGTTTKDEALALAYETGIVCSDEAVLYPDPYPSRDAWCRARLKVTERRLAELSPGTPTVLVSHFPTGTCDSARRPSSTGTFISPVQPGRTAFGSKKCRSVIRKSWH
jgi:hypothetical protein